MSEYLVWAEKLTARGIDVKSARRRLMDFRVETRVVGLFQQWHTLQGVQRYSRSTLHI
jgi:hypothetical protein